MSTAGPSQSRELIVADDGSIPADQVRKLGLGPGTHLRVVEAAPAPAGESLGASLPGFPDLSWEDFERGSALAREDAAGASWR
ncbi:MAG: hypothetical protein ACYC1D_02520 [Acidimicrobiales bacterium]